MVRGMRTKQMRCTMTDIGDNTFYIYYKQWQGKLSNILHWLLAFLSGHVQVPGFFLHFRMIHQINREQNTGLPQTSISHMYPRIWSITMAELAKCIVTIVAILVNTTQDPNLNFQFGTTSSDFP